VVACTGDEREDGQRRILISLRWEAGSVRHVEALRVPALVVRIKHRVCGIGTHPRTAAFVHGGARPRRRVIDPEQLHVRDFGERRQRCILVTRASHLGLVMSAFDADRGNAPCVSPLRIMRYAIFLPRKHFRLRNRNEVGAPTSSGELVELHPEATPGIRSAQFANVEAGQIQASPSSGSGPTSSCAPSPSALTKT